MMAEFSLVGCCMYWAFQYRGSIEAFVDFSASRGHCSGHKDFSLSVFSFRMAGSSTISHGTASGLRDWYSINRPVRSRSDQRVIITMIAPPGIKRCSGPV